MSSRRRHRGATICADPDCPEFATDNGRCAKHRQDVTGTGARGSTRASRSRRQEVLDEARDADGIPRCYYCHDEADRADHFVPLAEEGPDVKANLVASCTPCNGAKGKQMPDVFLASAWLARRCREVAGVGSAS